MRVKKNHSLLGNARELRRNMTPQELKLWYQFLRPYPLKFYKQRIIDSYIVDFYCAAARLVIEIDGSQHFEPEERAKDEARTAYLNGLGLQVVRFSNYDVDAHFESVCATIDGLIRDGT